MRARAPGKLLLSGAYAVLEGAPAVVCAVDRHAFAQGRGAAGAPAEVRAAMDDPPEIDTSALCDGDTKLGLGSSAAAVVAALALRAAERGEDVRDPAVRQALREAAFAAHAGVQGGGSGFDVAASVFGGVIVFRREGPAVSVQSTRIPPGLLVRAFFSGQSARTSDLRARVDALRARDAAAHAAHMAALAAIARRAAAAALAGDAGAFVAEIAASVPALAALGAAADAPIVPAAFADLAAAAGAEGAAFAPSGAGGGDVGVFVGTREPSHAFLQRAGRAGMNALDLHVDVDGVTVLS